MKTEKECFGKYGYYTLTCMRCRLSDECYKESAKNVGRRKDEVEKE